MKSEIETTASLLTITPEMAEKWLATTPTYQRKLDPKHVKRLTDAIVKGDWQLNGATIVFNSNNELVDGQHRLSAIVESGRSVQSLIVVNSNSSMKVFETLGDTKARKVTDFMHAKYPDQVAAVCRLINDQATNHWPSTGQNIVPIPEQLKTISKWQDQIELLLVATHSAGRVSRQHSFCAFLCLYYSHIQPTQDLERLTQFFARLGDGLNLELGDPVYQLRKRFLELDKTVRLTRLSAQAIILKALKAYLKHQTVRAIRFEPSREEFPTL